MKYIKTYDNYDNYEDGIFHTTEDKDYEIRHKKGYIITDDNYYIGASKNPKTGVNYLRDILCVKKFKKWFTVGKKYKLYQQESNKFMWIIDDRSNRTFIVKEEKNNTDFFLSNKNDFIPHRKQDDKNLFTIDDSLKDYELRSTANRYNL